MAELARLAAGLGRPVRRRLRQHAARGWATGAPDFVGVGAQRSGTTWWWRLLCDHPQIHPGEGKELHFFDDRAWHSFGEAEISRYHRLFPRPPGKIVGEWSPRYVHDFWAPAMLSRAAPEAKILLMLRDPFQRFHSGLSHELDRLPRRARRRQQVYVGAMAVNDALQRSTYPPQVERLFEHFPRERVLVLQYERCGKDPAAELRRTYSFLGADPVDYLPADEAISRSGRSPARVRLSAEVEHAVQASIRQQVPHLRSLLPDLDLALWPSCADAEHHC